MGFLRRYAFLAGITIIVSLFTIAVQSNDANNVAFAAILSSLVLCAIVIFFEEEDR